MLRHWKTAALAAVAMFIGTSDVRASYTAGHAVVVETTVTHSPTLIDSGSAPQPLDSDLTAFAGLTSAADTLAYFTGSHAMATTSFTSTARSLLDDTSTSAMRTTLGLAIGTNVEAWDADLDALAALSSSAGLLKRTGAGTFGLGSNGTDFTLVSAVSCTNQVMTALSASGSGTCSSVSNAMLSNSAVTISGHSLSLGGSLSLVSGDVTGTTTNDNASSGKLGEYAETVISTPVSLTTSTQANVGSLSLTAGDWEVSGVIDYYGDSSTIVTTAISGISTTSATLPSDPTTARVDSVFPGSFAPFATNLVSIPIGPTRISIASTTTVYLIADLFFTTSTAQATGHIRARRVR